MRWAGVVLSAWPNEEDEESDIGLQKAGEFAGFLLMRLLEKFLI